MAGGIEGRLAEIGIDLPAASAPMAAILRPTRIWRGAVLKVSAQLPKKDGKLHYIGRLGRDLGLEEGQAAAALCVMNALAHSREALDGRLDRIAAVLALRGYVNAAPDFLQVAEVVNGASELLIRIFGEEIGMHTRTAIGASVMPFGAAVEIEVEFGITG